MSHPLEEDAHPLTFSPDTLVDQLGNFAYYGEDDPEEAIEDDEQQGVAVGYSLQTMLLMSGLYNGDFLLPPPERDQPITDINALPYWRIVSDGSDVVTLHHVDDASAPGGKAIEVSVNAAPATDDETVQLEQIVPVSPRQRVKAPTIRVTDPGNLFVLPRIWVQFLTIDGTTTGTETTQKYNRNTQDDPGDVVRHRGIPSDARWMRIRIGAEIDSGVTAPNSFRILEAWNGEPYISYETWTFSDVALPGTGTMDIEAVAGNSNGNLAVSAERFIANSDPAINWVEAIQVRLSTQRTGGSCTFQLWHGTAGTGTGPIATINGTNTLHAWATQDLIDDATAGLLQNDDFRVRATGSSFTPTTADVLIHVRVAHITLGTRSGGST